jgi:RNA polymerase sigma factor for flagellar operon FliA
MSAPFIPAPATLSLVSEVIAAIARKRGLRPDEAEDFAQTVHLKLLERNYAPIAAFSGRCSLRSYLSVVVARYLLDWRNAQYGKWRPSAGARRLGTTAVDFERLVGRDGLSSDEALAVLSGRQATVDVSTLRSLAARIAPRARANIVALEDVGDVGSREFEDPVATRHAAAVRRRIHRMLRDAYRQLGPDDRRLLRLHFGRGLKIRMIARQLGVPAKPLYRRFERIKKTLRRALTREVNTVASADVQTAALRRPVVH